MALPNYDQKFRPAASERAAARIAQLKELPAGATVQIRAVVFRKASTSPHRWENDFRGEMTNTDVASVLDGTETITAAPLVTTPPRV